MIVTRAPEKMTIELFLSLRQRERETRNQAGLLAGKQARSRSRNKPSLSGRIGLVVH
jgi:hypothetical protein